LGCRERSRSSKPDCWGRKRDLREGSSQGEIAFPGDVAQGGEGRERREVLLYRKVIGRGSTNVNNRDAEKEKDFGKRSGTKLEWRVGNGKSAST